jgi:hypothetical protein
MKIFSGAVLFLAILPVSLIAQEDVSQVPVTSPADLPAPTNRRTLTVTAEERNPFSRPKIKPPTDTGLVQGDTEESRIRSTLGQLRVSGVTVNTDGSRSIVWGALLLKEGDQLPQLFPSQLERVVIKDISDNKIIFGFLDSDGTSENRSFSVVYSMEPKVRYALPLDAMGAAAQRRPFPLRGVSGNPVANEND